MQAKINKQGSAGFVGPDVNEELCEAYEAHMASSFSLYRHALAEGVAKEQARLFLPAFGLQYTAICTVDAHNLMQFLRLRMAEDAQLEIRVYARKIYEYFGYFMPFTAQWMMSQWTALEKL